MKQLSPIDASFLYMERENQPMHIGYAGFYDQSTAPDQLVRFKRIIQTFKERAHLAPYMRQRLKRVPMNLDYPYWVNDEGFDPEFHIRHIALPKPGDWRQFCIQVARLISHRLDLNKPLWEVYIIEGLNNVAGIPPNCFAMLTKVHHACVDGTSVKDVGVAHTDLTSEIQDLSCKEPWIPDAKPSDLELLMRSHLNNLHSPIRYLEFLNHTLPVFAKVADDFVGGRLKGADAPAPATRFNGNVSAHRVFDGTYFPLHDLKDIKASVPGATINDVILALCGGALRRYLEEKNELPDASMVAQCPINVRGKGSVGMEGNEVSSMKIQVRSDIEDPKARLIAIQDGTSHAKQIMQAISAKAMTEYARFLPSTLAALGARIAFQEALSSKARLPLVNAVITNVPGPQVPIYSNGARYVRGFGHGPIANGLGLFHSVGSYCGEVALSITSCREIMPDPANYISALNDSFKALKEATLGVKKVASISKKKESKATPKKTKSKTTTRKTTSDKAATEIMTTVAATQKTTTKAAPKIAAQKAAPDEKNSNSTMAGLIVDDSASIQSDRR